VWRATQTTSNAAMRPKAACAPVHLYGNRSNIAQRNIDIAALAPDRVGNRLPREPSNHRGGLLRPPAAIQHHQSVGAVQRGQAVRDGDGGASLH